MKKNTVPARKYASFITEVKRSIAQSRYETATLVNKNLLLLYLRIGRLLCEKLNQEHWGNSIVQTISDDIQDAFPGIKGFSVRNLYYMQQLHEIYQPVFDALQAEADQKKSSKQKNASGSRANAGLILQAVPAKLGSKAKKTASGRGAKKTDFQKNASGGRVNAELILQAVPAKLDATTFSESFFSVGFTHHISILSKCDRLDEKIFYLVESARNQWSSRVLDYHIEAGLFRRKGKLQSNFQSVLPEKMRDDAIAAFKDEYLLNFINIREDESESIIEAALVRSIRDFLMTLGNEFAFVGNQYRIVVDDEEYYIDLLFYHRQLRCLVAFELKTGKFKPEYMGKMNFYLSALDALVKLEHEAPSIGVILCKSKSKTVVEYAFRDTTKPIGVATVRYSDILPKAFRKYLPEPETLKKILK